MLFPNSEKLRETTLILQDDIRSQASFTNEAIVFPSGFPTCSPFIPTFSLVLWYVSWMKFIKCQMLIKRVYNKYVDIVYPIIRFIDKKWSMHAWKRYEPTRITCPLLWDHFFGEKYLREKKKVQDYQRNVNDVSSIFHYIWT